MAVPRGENLRHAVPHGAGLRVRLVIPVLFYLVKRKGIAA